MTEKEISQIAEAIRYAIDEERQYLYLCRIGRSKYQL